jgi:integrase/recombinase XerD
LHKFRHTYATTLLRDGVDLVSLQKLMGHNDMDSTRKYLRALEPADLLKKINLTTISTRFYSGT